MILLAQRKQGPRNAELVAGLYRAGEDVVVSTSLVEASELLESGAVDAVVIDDPAVPNRCPQTLCAWMLKAMESPPPMLVLARLEGSIYHRRCQRCTAVLDPDASAAEVIDRVRTLVDSAARAAGGGGAEGSDPGRPLEQVG